MKQDTMKKVLLGLSSVVLATSTGVAIWVLLRSRWYNEKKTYEKISKLASDLNELLINHPDREKIRDLLKLEQSKENRIKLEDEIKKMLVKEADERKNILDHINQINDPKKRQALLDELKEAKTWDVRSEILEKAKKQIAKEWEKKIKDKSDFAKSIIDQIKDDAVKQNLLDRLSKETEHADETLTDIDTIAKEAQQQVAKETNDAIEAIKAKMMELAYPGGVNANGTQDVINKLNAIQNSDNDDKTKMALAEKIANTFDDHNNKIKEVKAEIEKLEPSKQQVLLDKLDNAKFLHDDLNKTKEFDSLLNEVKALQDAELAEFTKGINALENLSPEEKQEFINSLPKGSSDADIKNKLKEAYKKDLENFIKKMDYPAKPSSAAQNALIQALTDNPDKYADNEKYLEELNRLKELSQLVDNANDSLNTIEGDKTALIEEFNNADTKEKLEALLQHIADEKHKEVLAAKRAKISSIIDSLPYPEGSEAAKEELKAAYANDQLTFTQLEQKEQEIREKIEPKVSEAKKKISKLSSDDQTKLNAEFKNAGSEEKLDALLAKINEAFNNSKEAQKSVIDDLTHLSPEQKEALKNQIDQATDFADIKKIVDRAQLLDKIEEAKSIITPESYALDENPEVKAIIDETIKSLKNQIEGLTDDQVAGKKAELDELNKKLKDYKNQIEALTENEVNNPDETKVDLAKELAKISNKDQFPNLDLEIAKAKLKKVASDLDYPGKPNNAAIKELQAQIEAVTTQEQLTQLDSRIKNVLPNKIAEAKAKIAEVRDSETTTRKQDLNRQLDEADTDEEFAALFKNIEKYKAQGDAEYSGKLKERLKEQAARLPYPDSNAAAKTALERRIEEENDIAELEKLQNKTIPSMLNKINELKEEIAKRSPENIAKLNEKLNNASTPEELAAIDAEITKAINDEKAAIAAKIDALAHLTPEQKDAAKAKLDNKTYSEMDDVLERAKRDNLLALVNKLGYNDSETLPAPARTSLRGAVETTPENELDQKLADLEALKTAIENEKTEIDQINYSSDDAEGKNDLKERLNNLTTAADVNSLVTPSEVNSKLSTYKDIINDVNNPLSQTQKSDLTSELDKLPKNGAESALRKEIFDAKKNAAITAINGLPSLTEERKRQLIDGLPSWTDSLANADVDTFKNKIDEITSKLTESRKEDLKAKIDALPFTGEATATKQSLKNAVDSITNEATYNAQKDLLDRYKDELVRTKNKINQVQDQTEKNSLLAQADNITNADNFSTLDTPIAKALDKDYIDTLTNLSEEEKRGFKDRISAQDNQAERNKIKEEARALNDLKAEKERLKAIVDQIAYPDKNAAATAINTLKQQIDALTADQISNKEQELNNLKNKVSAKVQIIDSLGDDLNSETTRNALKAEVNKATTTQALDNLVPDDLKSKLEGYKTLIEGLDLSEDIKTELKGLLAKTTNSGTVESKNFANLDQEIFNKFKDKVNDYITNAPHLPNKDAEHQTINALTLNNGDLSAGLQDLKNRLNDLHKKNYSAQIENLPFPKTDAADKNPAVERIKAEYVDNLNYGDDYDATEAKLNQLEPLMTAISGKINQINNQAVKDALNNLLMNASTVEKLEELKNKLDKYKAIADKINSINNSNILTTDSSFRETSTAIEELKTSLYNELSSTNNLDAFDTKVDEVIKTVNNAKSTFSNSRNSEYEILMIKTIVDEVKTGTTEEITNLNARIPQIRDKMRKFWHGDRGDRIREKQANLFNTANKTFNYNDLVRKMRSTTDLDALDNLVTNEVDLYLDVIAHREKEKATTNLPEDVQKSIREKLVAASNRTERTNISKYVGTRVFTNSNVTSGFFDDARQQLNAIPASNRSAWQTRFNDLATSNNDADVLTKIDNFNREARAFGNRLTPSRNKLDEYKRTYPGATETIQKLETLLNNASSINDLDNFDTLLTKVNDISSSINSLPYPNPSSANATTSKNTLLNGILPNVSGQTNEQQLATLRAVTAASLDPKVTEINNLSQAIQTEKDEINALSAYSTNAQALTNFKNELDKATTVAQTNVVPAGWNENVNKYKNLISTKFANHNTNGEINNLNTRLNQMIPNELDANKLADNTNVTYGENNMRKEIADEYSKYINKKFTDSNLSNLTTDQRTQFTNDINSLKSDGKINSTTSFENFKTEVIDKMDEKLNDAMITNFTNLVNGIPELSQTSKNNIINSIVKPNEKNTIETRKQNVQTQLNNLSTKVNSIISEIEGINDHNTREGFYLELAEVDTQQKADALYNKIRQFKSVNKTNAQRAIDALNQSDRGTLQSRLDAATEQSVVDALEQEALLTAAKVDAKKLADALPYPTRSSSTTDKSGMNKIKDSIDRLTTVNDVNNMKTTISSVRQALESAKEEVKLLTYDYDKNALNDELWAATTVDQMNAVKAKVLTKVKAEVKTRARTKLNAAAGLLRPEDNTSKSMTRSEEMYLEWFDREVDGLRTIADVRAKEKDFIFSRYADSIRMRAIALSVPKYFHRDFRFSDGGSVADTVRRDYEKLTAELRAYAGNYQFIAKDDRNKLRPDGKDERTLIKLVQEISNDMDPRSSSAYNYYYERLHKAWNISAQFKYSVTYSGGNKDNSTDNVRNKINLSIITKTLDKIKEKTDWSIDKIYENVYKITNLQYDDNGSVYDKLMNLKNNDADLGPLLRGNGRIGFDETAQVWELSYNEANKRN